MLTYIVEHLLELNFIQRFVKNSKLPVILQSENTECALACLAMVLSYYGYICDITHLRQKFRISMQGVNLESLVQMIDSLHLNSRVVKISKYEYKKLITPCILNSKDNHFVVLSYVGEKYMIVHDPAIGKRKILINDFNSIFHNIAIELIPKKGFNSENQKQNINLNFFIRKINNFKSRILSIIGLSLLLQIGVVALSILPQLIIDYVIPSFNTQLLLFLVMGFIALTFAHLFIQWLKEKAILSVSKSLNLSMSQLLFDFLLEKPLEYFTKRHIGEQMSKFQSLVFIRDFISIGFITIFVEFMLFALTLSMMLIYDYQMALITLLFVLVYVLIRILLYGPIRLLNEENIVAKSKESSFFIETIRAIQPIMLYKNRQYRKNKWKECVEYTVNKNNTLVSWNIRNSIIYGIIFGLESILILYLATLNILNGNFTVGMLFAYLGFKLNFTSSVEGLINKYLDYKMLDLHFARLSDIFLHTSKNNSTLENVQLPQTPANNIIIKELSYKYGDFDPYIFKHKSFNIPLSVTTVITGRSGSGKSTFIKCLVGLLSPTSGKIYINDDANTTLLNVDKIASIMQNDILLNGTILDNITFFSEHVDYKKVERCTKIACIHYEIEKFAMKYDTLVGDMGTTLSGGQVQRIIIARALYQNPSILIMDEATSNIDTETEVKILNHLQSLNLTLIIITHNPNIISNTSNQISFDT